MVCYRCFWGETAEALETKLLEFLENHPGISILSSNLTTKDTADRGKLYQSIFYEVPKKTKGKK